MAGSFVNLFVDSYFLTFCTYVLGISAAWMATLFLVAWLDEQAEKRVLSRNAYEKICRGNAQRVFNL